VPILLAALLLAACSSGHGGATATSPSRAAGPTTAGSALPAEAPQTEAPQTEPPQLGVPEVRDAFAVLQATYNDGCTSPGNCEYFLTRVLSNLDDLYRAMNASPKGSGHFAAPIRRIGEMRAALHGDSSFANLKEHQKLLLATRDAVNTWMQSHPDDYR
jgi:hypothetical protein